jgi:hypothetical protein
MAATDAEMPDHKALNEDLQEIAKHLEALRSNLDALAQCVGATGTHQTEALKAQAGETLSAMGGRRPARAPEGHRHCARCGLSPRNRDGPLGHQRPAQWHISTATSVLRST